MRLLKQDKATIVNDVIAALPDHDYAEKLRVLAQAIAVDKLPHPAQLLWRNPATRGLLNTEIIYWFGHDEYGYHRGIISSVSVPGYSEVETSIKADPEIEALIATKVAERDARAKLRRELTATLANIGTVEEFKVRLPDLVSYLPTAADAVVNLPSTSAVQDSLKAAGLPVPKELEEAA